MTGSQLLILQYKYMLRRSMDESINYLLECKANETSLFNFSSKIPHFMNNKLPWQKTP